MSVSDKNNFQYYRAPKTLFYQKEFKKRVLSLYFFILFQKNYIQWDLFQNNLEKKRKSWAKLAYKIIKFITYNIHKLLKKILKVYFRIFVSQKIR